MSDWPHSPLHVLDTAGTYIVTAGTYQKVHHLQDATRLGFVQDALLDCAKEFGWRLQAWAVLSNHYHFVANAPESAESLRPFLNKLHSETARWLNERDDQPGRKVWYQYYESRITYQRSYLARLKYVHQNAVHHGVAANASNYQWCSAAWFERKAPAAFVKTVESFGTARLRVMDSYECVVPSR